MEDCRACSSRWPLQDHKIADCGLSVAYLFEDQFFPGWTVLVLKRHVTELFHLNEIERGHLMEEVAKTAEAITAVFQPVKINYAVLGNQLPHMHWHVIPRLVGDPAPREAVWGHDHEPVKLTGKELTERIERIRTAITQKLKPRSYE